MSAMLIRLAIFMAWIFFPANSNSLECSSVPGDWLEVWKNATLSVTRTGNVIEGILDRLSEYYMIAAFTCGWYLTHEFGGQKHVFEDPVQWENVNQFEVLQRCRQLNYTVKVTTRKGVPVLRPQDEKSKPWTIGPDLTEKPNMTVLGTTEVSAEIQVKSKHEHCIQKITKLVITCNGQDTAVIKMSLSGAIWQLKDLFPGVN